jgi:putative hydrolase of the HAD superfamily
MIEEYEEINRGLWDRYEAGKLDKHVMRALRFRNTLLRFGVKNDKLAGRMGELYLERTPLRSGLFEEAREVLTELRPHFGLHLITNGFEEVQATKLRSSGIDMLFDHVITSERAGARKPQRAIFDHALKKASAVVEESLMIGDSIGADMEGARGMGMDHVHFVPEGEPDPRATWHVRHFRELRKLLRPSK